jgi:hypothetical protein
MILIFAFVVTVTPHGFVAFFSTDPFLPTEAGRDPISRSRRRHLLGSPNLSHSPNWIGLKPLVEPFDSILIHNGGESGP